MWRRLMHIEHTGPTLPFASTGQPDLQSRHLWRRLKGTDVFNPVLQDNWLTWNFFCRCRTSHCVRLKFEQPLIESIGLLIVHRIARLQRASILSQVSEAVKTWDGTAMFLLIISTQQLNVVADVLGKFDSHVCNSSIIQFKSPAHQFLLVACHLQRTPAPRRQSIHPVLPWPLPRYHQTLPHYQPSHNRTPYPRPS